MSSTVNEPLIWPEPPVIGSRMTGADNTLPSSTMAKGRPTFRLVISANWRAPALSNRNETIGSCVRWSKPARASTRRSPLSATLSSIG